MTKKKSGSAAQRSKKKHQKELKRRPKVGSPPLPQADRDRPWNPEKEGIERLSRRVRRSFATVAHQLPRMSTVPLDALPAFVWTRPRIAALATSELLVRLAALGITTTEADFVAAIEAESSAVRFATRAWLPLVPRGSGVHDRDFVLLAACALFQRLRPEPPSIEAVVEDYLVGGDHAAAKQPELALPLWLRFFERLRPRLTPSIRTIRDLDELLDGGIDDADGWLQMLFIVGRQLGTRAPDLTRRAAAVLGEIAERLSGEPADFRMSVVDDQARLLAGIGEKAEGERALRSMIAHVAPDPEYWITLVDFLTDDSEDPRDLRGAIAALEAANALLGEAEENWAIRARIPDLRAQLLELGEDPDAA